MAINTNKKSTMRTRYDKAKINKVQVNNKCRLCSDKDETIYHIGVCGKLVAWKYNIRHN